MFRNEFDFNRNLQYVKFILFLFLIFLREIYKILGLFLLYLIIREIYSIVCGLCLVYFIEIYRYLCEQILYYGIIVIMYYM